MSFLHKGGSTATMGLGGPDSALQTAPSSIDWQQFASNLGDQSKAALGREQPLLSQLPSTISPVTGGPTDVALPSTGAAFSFTPRQRSILDPFYGADEKTKQVVLLRSMLMGDTRLGPYTPDQVNAARSLAARQSTSAASGNPFAALLTALGIGGASS